MITFQNPIENKKNLSIFTDCFWRKTKEKFDVFVTSMVNLFDNVDIIVVNDGILGSLNLYRSRTYKDYQIFLNFYIL